MYILLTGVLLYEFCVDLGVGDLMDLLSCWEDGGVTVKMRRKLCYSIKLFAMTANCLQSIVSSARRPKILDSEFTNWLRMTGMAS